MTVKELIEKLESMHPDALVLIENESHEGGYSLARDAIEATMVEWQSSKNNLRYAEWDEEGFDYPPYHQGVLFLLSSQEEYFSYLKKSGQRLPRVRES